MTLPHGPCAAAGAPATLPAWCRCIVDSALGTWIAALIFVGVPCIAVNIATKLLIPEPELRDIRNLMKALVLIAAYWAYFRWWERRPVHKFSLMRALPESLARLLLGGLFVSAVVAVLAGLGTYSFETVGSADDFDAAAALMLPKIVAGALIEEFIFRLMDLRLLGRSFGAVWALVISSLLFGLAHLGNAGASLLIGIMLGVELGLLPGAAYLLTRRIWLCAATHPAWDLVQGVVFSIAVSSQAGDGWLRGTFVGPS